MTVRSEASVVVVFAPIGRDAPMSAELLSRGGIRAEICADLPQLQGCLAAGVDAALITEEALVGQDLQSLFRWVEQQPPWSDLPFVVLTSSASTPAILTWRQQLVNSLRNVSLLERPLQAITLVSAVQSAVRARARQHEIQRLMAARERVAQELEDLVHARTVELEQANLELQKQMTERERAEESLRQSQKIEALGQLTGGVAHDFNNLLMVISGGLDMLGRANEPARRQTLLDGMRQAAQRGASLTKQLLAFSRRQPLQAQSVDLARQIGGMKELLDRSLRGDVKVELDFYDSLWPVQVDPSELELVMLNLAVNARDAMPNGGSISIRARNLSSVDDGEIRGDYVRLEVTDTGTGIAPELVERVFEPFFTTKEVGKGSGLGLAQVYGFVKQSGGAVAIESELGKGTRVIIRLPRATSKPVRDSGDVAELHVARHAPKSAGCVLVVEDEDEVAALVKEMLGELGFDVLRVASAEAALGALSNGRKVDLLFSDIVMPGEMNGLELAREVRARIPDLPVVLTSGYAQTAIQDAEAEGLFVLRKPYRLKELAMAVEANVTLRSDKRTSEALRRRP